MQIIRNWSSLSIAFEGKIEHSKGETNSMDWSWGGDTGNGQLKTVWGDNEWGGSKNLLHFQRILEVKIVKTCLWNSENHISDINMADFKFMGMYYKILWHYEFLAIEERLNFSKLYSVLCHYALIGFPIITLLTAFI